MARRYKSPAVVIPQQNEGSAQPDHKECEGIEVLYVRSDLLSRFRNSPLLAKVVMSAAEYAQLCKTRLGRVYVASFQWQTCSQQSLFG